VFKNNPLAEVICQLRFPTILAIAAEAPAAFQDRIRGAYPLYEQEPAGLQLQLQGLPPEVASLVAQVPFPQPATDPVHKFLSEDRKRFISLKSDFVAFTETSYSRWETFKEGILLAERALTETRAPAFYTRIGLRYRNVISRKKFALEGQPWHELLQPHLTGLLGLRDLAQEVTDIRAVASVRVDQVPGARVELRHGLMPDPDDSQQAYLIDVDFHTEERSTGQDAFRILDDFHSAAGDIFRWAIAPPLRLALQPEDSPPNR
jgi:uncharacterized protein (TIGR04255 family)